MAVAALLILSIGSVDGATVTVASINFRFDPESQTVNVGDVVRWTFAGDPHTVTSGPPGAPDGRFESGIMSPGGSFQLTFTSAGTFPYYCQIHPEQMFGTIVVGAGATPSPEPTAAPTPKPTAAPTAEPTARPTSEPTAAPTAAPTLVPTATPGVASSAPRTDAPGVSPTSTPATAPIQTSAPATLAPAASALASLLPSAAPANGPETASGPTIAVGVGVLVVLIAAGGLIVLGRRRRI
jgi:plastocyanin